MQAGFIPNNLADEDVDGTSVLSCQSCRNSPAVNKIYVTECYFDQIKSKEDLVICISCLHDYHQHAEELTGNSRYSKPKLVVADKVCHAKHDIFDACPG